MIKSVTTPAYLSRSAETSCFDLQKVRHHYCEKPFVALVDCHFEDSGLENEQEDGTDVWNQVSVLRTSIFWFGGRPKQGVNRVLAENRQQF